MSCTICDNEKTTLEKTIDKAKKYVKDNNKTVVVYQFNQTFGYEEAETFYKQPCGKIECIISFV